MFCALFGRVLTGFRGRHILRTSVEESVKLRFYLTFLVIGLLSLATNAGAQVNTVLGQFTSSASSSLAGSISGNGRFVVFESRGDVATENPRNADGNLEIFLWDYAQRRIYQITDTKSLVFDTTLPASGANVRVAILNTRPVISNDGRWIAFTSNATIAYPGDATNPPIVSNTNPGSFDANAFTAPTPTVTPTPSPSPSASPTVTPTPTPGANSLTNDGNLELWLYQIPAYADVADLSAGAELPVTNLSGGTFIRATNTVPSALPRAGTAFTAAFVAADNHDPSINDDGSVTAFVSSRDLVAGSNSAPDDNDEIFTYLRAAAATNQITKTPRGAINSPIYNKNPTISGNGNRIAFAGTGENPANAALTCGSNPSTSRNEEVFFIDLAGGAVPTACKQITTTTPTTAGAVVNNLGLGRRMGRDGRYIAFDSFADLAGENSGTNFASFALYVYDTTLASNAFRRVGPRSDADTAATGGDVDHFPSFTDNDAGGSPSTLMFETRNNIKADGSIPATAADGLNPDATRPPQIYSYPLDVPAASATFKRLTTFPASPTFLPQTQPITSDSHKRTAFNLAFDELGTGNADGSSEAYYLIQPDVTDDTTGGTLNFTTGASGLAVSASPVPTPSPTATASPSPTPQTPSAVQGLSPGMLAIVNYEGNPVVSRTAVGSFQRSFALPIELSGVTLTINGVGCGLKSVGNGTVTFVVPPALAADVAGTSYPVVLNNNGVVIKTTMTLVPARPDIFTKNGVVGPGGRAKLFNVTNPVPTGEPFLTFTVMLRGGMRVPSKMRLYLTGVQGMAASNISIRIGSSTVTSITTGAVAVEPGVYTIDFAMPTNLIHAGDQPIIVTINVSGTNFNSRLDDTAPRLFLI